MNPPDECVEVTFTLRNLRSGQVLYDVKKTLSTKEALAISRDLFGMVDLLTVGKPGVLAELVSGPPLPLSKTP